jgi:hypothetical protein
MNFRLAANRIQADLSGDLTMTTDWPSDRPVFSNPELQTDGLDPAAEGGPSPLNGTGPLGEKVVSDPLTPVPQKDIGGTMPHTRGPDVDTTVLKNYRTV